MLVVETIGRIRREHRIKGKSIKGIARDLKVSRNTVRKVLRSGATSFDYMRVVQPRPKLGAWHGDLDRMLSDNEARPARERLTTKGAGSCFAQTVQARSGARSTGSRSTKPLPRTVSITGLPPVACASLLRTLLTRR